MSTVGEVIGRHHDAILHLWGAQAGRAASAEGLTPPELISMMPDYLASLGRSGEDDAVELSSAQQSLIERHLSRRLRQGFALNEIVTELAVLGRCVSRVVDGEPARSRPAVGDVARFFGELHAAVVEVTRIFNEHMLEDQQRVKRYNQLLQRIASEAMSSPDRDVPMRKLLTEALTVVMAAMTAQTAALLLFDVENNRLIVSASTGMADEHLGEYVSSLDVSTLGGKIASSGDGTTFVTDAETTGLTVSDALRESGVHSLLGVRLAAGRLLRGVLYVGISERRAFTPSEVRRIEELGTSLTMHLDNARLHAVLIAERRRVELEGRLREQFVSVLMHDLGGPLEAARAGAERLRGPHLVDDPERVAAAIVQDLDRMEWMVRGLLDVHQIRSGKRLPLRLSDCDLGAIAREAMEELRAAHGDRFQLHADSGVRGMWSPDQLRRAIWNLALNGAVHGAASRLVTISVTGGRAGAEVAVHNEGPEIPAEIQEELFHPFSLPGSAIHGSRCGWGLGLIFVWGCAEAHGGQVVAESRAGEGTTFRLRIPCDARPYVD
ncbi:MAG TPA: ATP-binding protein [Kofleriaceae bacterium]|nr:ATP-binding protein [Kofleriaceae bacterium]